MSVPTYDQFIEPLLRYLTQHPDGVPARQAHEAAADALGLGDDDRQLLLSSGAQPIYKNRVGWAHDRLKRAGFSSSPRRGVWQITPEGIRFAADHPAPLTAEQVQRLAMAFNDVRLRPVNGELAVEPTTAAPASPAAVASPDDRLSQALLELRQTAEAELLDLLARVSPSFFETIVLDLLHRMGYGASRADLQRVGGAGDAGIDGIISLDRLGLEKVYVQAKRWQSAIGRPELQAFYGALAGQKAKKGVFITTSAFTTQALDFAKSVEGIVLVDGVRLVGLMVDHEVGITSHMVRIPKIDSDYFDEEIG
ncbi:MAG: restriction endonuclease [Pseudomonadota bacterium]